MYSTVLTASRSPQIGNGLTYRTVNLAVGPGSLVRVSLRGKAAEGIVLEICTDKPADLEEAVMKDAELLATIPLLTSAQVTTLRWMASYYYCTLRQALGPFLPSPPWSRLLREKKKKETEVQRTLTPVVALPELTALQQQALEKIHASTKPALLFGVTGSGKTAVYAHLIAETAARDGQSILLVPEILLTEHAIARFEQLFDRHQIALLHSRLTPAARRAEWQRIHRGEVMLIIGSRSALFAPCQKLGLVIIDEEHEWTYKNEQTPRYHARETAETLCAAADARLVLGTATPSLEAWQRAKEGRYTLVRMPERYSGLQPPQVRVVDLGTAAFGGAYPFSPPLLDAIRERLEKKEQSVLFLNRRGMATALLCLECRRRVLSPASQMPFTVHRGRDGKPILIDHIAGSTAPVPATCPACGSPKLHPVGAGTQRVEETLRRLFPTARLLRADSDTLSHPEEMRRLLHRMEERDADILLGTQSVVKGLDLPYVTLAAVLLADVGLSLPHFRAGERVFQLLTQLVGRSGRARQGDVIIQTFRPDALEVRAAAGHHTEQYIEEELRLRTLLHYPPATSMVRLVASGVAAQKHAKEAQRQAMRIIEDRRLAFTATCAPTLFGAGRIWHVLLRGNDARTLLGEIDLSAVTIDVDPIECL